MDVLKQELSGLFRYMERFDAGEIDETSLDLALRSRNLYRRALELLPDGTARFDATFRMQLGNVLLRIGCVVEAVSELRRAISTWAHLGNLHELGRSQSVMAQAMAAAANWPRNPSIPAWGLRGLARCFRANTTFTTPI